MPFAIFPMSLNLHLHDLFFQIEELQCVSCFLFVSCAKMYTFIMFLCVTSSSTDGFSAMSEWLLIEHRN